MPAHKGAFGKAKSQARLEGRASAFLGSLSPQAAGALLEGSYTVTYPTGAVLYSGDPRVRPGIVTSGRLRILVEARDGRRVGLAYAGEGAPLGLARCFAPGFEATVEALAPTTVLHFTCSALASAMETDSSAAQAVTRHLAGDLKATLGRMREHVFGSARQRIARQLLAQAQPDCEGRPCVEGTRQQLAEAAGIVREHATRIVNQLRREGLVTTSRGALVILDAPALRRVARL